jgi:hypothetical protein
MNAIAIALAAAALAAGCADSSSKNSAGPSVVTKTVTLAHSAAKPDRSKPRPAPAPPVAPSYSTFTGSYFSIDYPDTWSVESSEASKGGYVDTTIRSLTNPSVMLRVDVTPPSGGAASDASSSANVVERALSSQPGYQELRFASTTFGGYSAVDWEFVVREQNVLLHKRDTFFNDDTGDVVAVLTQAPASQFTQWRYAFAHVRQSLLVTSAVSPPPPPPAAPGFCTTHSYIPRFYDGTGYIVQCTDGMWSHSGGLSGACSYHGGESSNIYLHRLWL